VQTVPFGLDESFPEIGHGLMTGAASSHEDFAKAGPGEFFPRYR